MSDNLNNNQELSVEVVTFQDDDGNEFDMEIVDEFEHAGRKFAVLAEILEDACGDEACAGDQRQHHPSQPFHSPGPGWAF